MSWEVRAGRWQDALADVESVDAVIADPPYSARTHDGHDDAANMVNREGEGWGRSNGGVDAFRPRRTISYAPWGEAEVNEFVDSWVPRCTGWLVILSDSELCPIYRAAFERSGLTGFQPVPCVIWGMTLRMCGDGPSSWAVYANVARPKSLARWGTLPGAYAVKQGDRVHIGGKPESLMELLVRDYSNPGDLVCDPCAGSGTTLLAALHEARSAIGSEMDAEAAEVSRQRIEAGYTPDLFSALKKNCAKCNGWFLLGAFYRDRSQEVGRQSWCRRCKDEWEVGPHGVWKRFRAMLRAEEPASLKQWTEEQFLAEWTLAGGRCVPCGARLDEWQVNGHRMDRIDNTRPHVPGNSQLCCWPCNRTKNHNSPLAADQVINSWVQKYGRGKVPWGQIMREDGIKPARLFDVEKYRQAHGGQQLSLQLSLLQPHRRDHRDEREPSDSLE